MKIHAECLVRGSMDRPVEIRRRCALAPDGLFLAEHRLYESESDFVNSCEGRVSPDGGKNWSKWKDIYGEYYRKSGDDEYVTHNCLVCETYNPVHDHYVGALMEMYFRGGRRASFARYWAGQEPKQERVSLIIRQPGEESFMRFPIRYDERDEKNLAYFGTNVAVMRSGDILLPLGPSVAHCCALAGISVEDVFPSAPELMHGCIIARGRWNAERTAYDFTFSTPMILGDLLSSRGIDEPTVAELSSGRILVVFRGSNMRSDAMHTRIEPGAPAIKWYAYSDDGGSTFSPVMPWRTDRGEVVYSSATISLLFRQPGGGLYWLGNVTGPGAKGNMPRYPLLIGRVDERYGTLLADSVAVIDTRREGETEDLQLSNFYLAYLDGKLEVTLTKFGQFSTKEAFHGDTWRYYIEL